MDVSRNLTARKTAELERDRMTEHLRGQIDRMPLAYLRFDSNLRVIEWNAAAERTFGYRKEEMLGVGPPFEKILPASAWPVGRQVLERLRAGDMAAHSINDNVTKDGRTITCEWNNTPLFDAHGAFAGLVSLVQDITERRRSERALRESEERFRQIAESISEVFWLASADKGAIEYVSPAYETIWGRSRASALSDAESWLGAIHPEDRDRVRAALAKQVSGDFDEEYRIVRPDGTIRWIRDRAFPVRDEEGRAVRVAGVAEDITERRALEEHLRKAQKMEAIGQLAAGIAHDFNNLLTVIIGASDLILDEPPDLETTQALAAEINRAGKRSAALTRQLLLFSRQQVLAPRILDINEIIRGAEKLLGRVVGEDIELHTELAPGLGSVHADPGQLEQLLLNLAVNARDAMPQGGRLTVETRQMAAPGDASPQVLLTVTDTGVGMSDRVKRRLFEPFFTTKPIGKGTGLGLAVVHGVVKQSGGSIEVESQEGRGTSFRICLPSVAGAAATPGAGAAAAALPRGEATILVVEDEDSVRGLIRRVLERCGYTVLDARNGEHALRLVERQPRIDLLLTDVVMPEMGGRILADRLNETHPAMPVLYVSGYANDAIVRHGVLHDRVNFLQKPFSPAEIAQKVRDVLSASGVTGEP